MPSILNPAYPEGGYIGGYLQAMLHHKQLEQTLTELLLSSERSDADAGSASQQPRTRSSAISDSVLKLRSYSNFLSPNKRPLSGDRISMVSTPSDMLLTQTQLGALVLTLTFLPAQPVIALQWLSHAPLLTWFLATAFCVIALVLRPRDRATDSADVASGQPAKALSPGASVVPPLGLAVSFVLLASLLWSGNGFENASLLAIDASLDVVTLQLFKSRFVNACMALIGQPVAGDAGACFAPLAIASTYLVGFFTCCGGGQERPSASDSRLAWPGNCRSARSRWWRSA
ncbi:hypothetical protein [Lysobacter enzymogenes]|uniref:hypothetical protein n=1 Tax=Lysobacter enzymogenes TaxID=69 RepID=UPI002263EC6E|nr:hypothetical protein [Lysobacter enzymogenes]UZW60641.1 hypothetical protein BV903_025900 [Lysobacter enzymogenes]